MKDGFLSHLEWRHAEKNFDPSKALEEDKLNKIIESIHMAPSSFGMQPYHIYVIQDQAPKDKIRKVGFDQAQFSDAPVLMVFASRTDLSTRADEFFEAMSGGDDEKREQLKGFEDMLRGFLGHIPDDYHQSWSNRQAYIALGFAMAAAAELEVDSCPMEGFDPAGVDEILGLPENLKSVVTLSLGYNDGTDPRPKFRFSKEDLFTWLS